MTIITFIGLFVLTAQNLGYKILMPTFPGHDSIIAWRHGDRAGGTWGPIKTFPKGTETWEYVGVQKQKITFDGAASSAPRSVDVPHLSCCCAALGPTENGGKGIQGWYTDGDLPGDQKKGAQVLMPEGTAKRVIGHGGRIETEFDLSAPTGITITGTHGQGQGAGASKTIVLNAGAQIIFGDTPICAISDPDSCPTAPPRTPPDFLMYYQMAAQQNTCTAAPSTCPDCKQHKGKCEQASTCQMSKIHEYMVTVDCSNSQWP